MTEETQTPPVDTAPQPVTGGSYVRHPETHELTLVDVPAPATEAKPEGAAA